MIPEAVILAFFGVLDKGLELALIVIKDIPAEQRREFWIQHFERDRQVREAFADFLKGLKPS
jgi:hypothetical protein